MRPIIALCLAVVMATVAVACTDDAIDEAPTATQELAATEELEPTVTEVAVPTDTPPPPATEALQPTQPPVTNRRDCGAIRGTAYLSEEERQWFQANCVSQEPPAQQPPAQPPQACHPSYIYVCLDPNASDYDCAGGSGNGPYYTGRVIVVGPDVYDLDRDGDTVGCE